MKQGIMTKELSIAENACQESCAGNISWQSSHVHAPIWLSMFRWERKEILNFIDCPSVTMGGLWYAHINSEIPFPLDLTTNQFCRSIFMLYNLNQLVWVAIDVILVTSNATSLVNVLDACQLGTLFPSMSPEVIIYWSNRLLFPYFGADIH